MPNEPKLSNKSQSTRTISHSGKTAGEELDAVLSILFSWSGLSTKLSMSV